VIKLRENVAPGNLPAHLHAWLLELVRRVNALSDYAPAVLADWDASTDPGDVDDALDQLAERVTDLEGAGAGADSGHVVEGRLTLESGVPVSRTDQTSKSTVYFTPYKGNQIKLWDGSAWTAYTFSETSYALSGLVAHTNYDIFGYQNAGSLALEALKWEDATVTMTLASPGVCTHAGTVNLNVIDTVSFTTTGALPTGLTVGTLYWVNYINATTFNVAATQGGASINLTGSQSGVHTAHFSRSRATAVTLQDGRYCKSGDKTRLYLGTFRTTSSSTTEDSGGGAVTQVGGKRFLWNNYNRIRRWLRVWDSTSSWSYATLQVRQANGAVGNKVEFVTGIVEETVTAVLSGAAYLSSNSGRTARISIGYLSTTAFDTGANIGLAYNVTASNGWYPMMVSYESQPGLGYASLNWLESGSDGSCSFAGTNGSTMLAGLNASHAS
jgi:hypothetical protein